MPKGKNKIKQCDYILAKMHPLPRQEDEITVLFFLKKDMVYMKKFIIFLQIETNIKFYFMLPYITDMNAEN